MSAPISNQAATGHRWAVVGAGMLGLTLALRLRQQGKQVTLIEAAPELGGMASAWRIGDVTWDRHYHVSLLSDSKLRRVLAELDLDHELEWAVTRTGVFAGGKLHSVSNTLEMLRFPVLAWTDVLRLGATIIWASRVKDWRALEQIPVSDWLRRWSGERTFKRFWLPLLRSKLGDAYTDTSAAFIWATIQRLYAARRSGMKKEMFGTVAGGYARVMQRFGERLQAAGVQTMLGAPVAQISADNGGLRVQQADGSSSLFDHVVVTAAAPAAARICPGLTEAELKRLRGVRYLGIVCASVLLRRPLDGFYVTNLLDSGLPFTGVIEMSAMARAEHFSGRGLVYLPRYAAPDDPVFDQTDAQIEGLFIDGLRRVYPQVQADDVLAFKVSRVRHVMPLPTINYSQQVPAIETSIHGLHLVNSAHIVNGTLNVNETVHLAETAAARFSTLE